MRRLANQLAQAGDDVELLATAEPGDTAAATGADRARIAIFPRVTPRWAARSPALRQHLQAVSFDCVHHHSLWLRTLGYATDATRRKERPLVISPRA